MKSSFALLVVSCLGLSCFAVCPSADLTGDCYVDIADFAEFALQWLTGDGVPDDMVSIPGGAFQMGDSLYEGSPIELPVHTVTLDSFFMGKYPITNGQYAAFLNSVFSQGLISIVSGVVYQADSGTSYPYCDTYASVTSSQIEYIDGFFSVRRKSGRSMENDPIVGVSWFGAAAYCNWRSEQEDKEPCYDLLTWNCDFSKNGYRLPTEAQWEYAARGGLVGKRFPWGDLITHRQANYFSSSVYTYDVSSTRYYHPTWNDGTIPYTFPVGSYAANDYGLYDMAGNVWQWCNDWYIDYTAQPQINPTGPKTGSSRVLRGGSWGGNASLCRVVYRNGGIRPMSRSCFFGFRIALGN